jgi:hypothetical protein
MCARPFPLLLERRKLVPGADAGEIDSTSKQNQYDEVADLRDTFCKRRSQMVDGSVSG